MTGTRRTLGVNQHDELPLTPTELRGMIPMLVDNPTSLRDRALLLVFLDLVVVRSLATGACCE